MNPNKGYLLPPGELGDDEIACTFVFYPDREEYRAALQGSLAYLATWIAWEKDAEKRGKDAAENWREAYELTTECWRMGCFEQLQDDVSDILDFLRSKKDCCDDSLTYGPATEVTTDIDPGVGDPPDFYGETAVTDWDDWYEHVCFNAHEWVDSLIAQAETISTALAVGGIALGLIAATLGAIAFLATGGVLSVPIMMAISAALAAGGSSSMFTTAATDLENSRTDIVCALMLGNSVSDAVEGALTIASSWTLFFAHADFDTATAIIYEGGQGTNYLPTETRDDCTGCEHPYNFDVSYDFTSGAQGWVPTNFVYDAGDKSYSGKVGNFTCYLGKTKTSILSDIGHVGASKLEINYMEAEYRNYNVISPPTNVKNRMRKADTSWLEFPHTVPDNGVDHVHIDIFPNEEMGANLEMVALYEAGGASQWVFLDNIRLRGWVTD